MKISFLRRLWVTLSIYVIGFYASFLNRFEVNGVDNIPGSGGVLIASNHISAYETIFLPWAVIGRFSMQMLWAPAKEELFRNRLLGFLYKSWGAFPVNRGRDIKAARRINDLLKDQKVMIFPEGTRHKNGALGKGNRGVGKIVYDTRPIVIPTALIGLNCWKFPRLHQHGKAVFGEPVDFTDLYQLVDNKITHQIITDRIMESIASLLRKEGAYVNPD
ncbi:MAG: 1-acyl-sn-glycerol-3-phosphate acyltransferase [Geobacteraceae bacterium]|nr:1-acyl-sn-glycerol-3-phosphate acyltransferase [Geobacteraceae bacterium]